VKTGVLLKQFFKYLLVWVFVWACSEDSTTSLVNQNYFPLVKGNFWIYDVEEIQYNQGNSVERLYQLKLEVVDSFPNVLSGFTYIIHQFERPNESMPWEFLKSGSVQLSAAELVFSEGNTPIIHLAFPAKKGRKWDANVYNTFEEDEYAITDSGITYHVSGGLSFNGSVVVEQEDLLTVIDQDQRKEVYSYRVGLIYKEYIVIEFDQFGNRTPQDGIYYVQRLVTFGVK
jgi:hypothetical protein